jgi:uncharacterized caspase-like protein
LRSKGSSGLTVRPAGLLPWLRVILTTAVITGFTQAVAQDALTGVALVIGQSSYDANSGLRTLRNPVNDARALDDLFTDLGFDVERELDATGRELRRTLEDFAEEASGADVAVLYYSGHGIEAGGESYLVPIDADMSTPESAGRSLVPLRGLLDELQQTVKLTIVLFDACRTNSMPAGQQVLLFGTNHPVPISPEGLGPGAAATRGHALAPLEVTPETIGSIVGFAASPDRPALDGDGENSPFAAALLKHLGAGGAYDLQQIMTLVTQEVYVETSARQLPWTHSSLLRFVSLGAQEEHDPDEALIREGRRELLLSIAPAPYNMRAVVEEIALADDVPLAALYGTLRVIGDEVLINGSEQLVREASGLLRNRLATQLLGGVLDPEIERLARLADRAEGEGAIEVALHFRELASQRARTLSLSLAEVEDALRNQRLELAATFAAHGETAILNQDYAAAVARFAEARREVDDFDEVQARIYRLREAIALSGLGFSSADEKTSLTALTDLERLAGEINPDQFPDEWSRAQYEIANTAAGLGQRRQSLDLLRSASGALRRSLLARTQLRTPTEWAETFDLIATVLTVRVQLGDDAQLYWQAVHAARQVLLVRTKEAGRLAWARANLPLINGLIQLGLTTGDSRHLREALSIVSTLEAEVRLDPQGFLPEDLPFLQEIKGLLADRISEMMGT